MSAIIGIFLRHALSGIGVYLTAKGYADEQTAEMVVGSLGTLGAFALSFANKKRNGIL